MIRTGLLAVAMACCGAVRAAAPPAPDFDLALVDMQGQKKMIGTLPGSTFSPRVSPDGRRVAFEMVDPASGSTQALRIHVADLAALDKPRMLQATPISTRNLAPVWSDDGEYIAFVATGNGNDALFWQRADGGLQPKWLAYGRAAEGLYRGRQMAFITRRGETDYGISLLDLTTRKVTPLVDLPGSAQHSSQFSPDGRWMAYASDETGRPEIWLEPLPRTSRRFQLTKQGGRHPVWSPDGRTVYFDQGGRMFRLPLTFSGDGVTAAEAVGLPITGFVQGDARRQFDILPDGSAFLMLFARSP